MSRFFLFCGCVLFLFLAARPTVAQKIRADVIELRNTQTVVKNQHRIYRGNALLVLKDCALRADRFDAYSIDGVQVRLVASGHVKLVVKKKSPLTSFTLVGQKAEYNARNNEIRIEGDVRFLEGESGFVRGLSRAVKRQTLTAMARTVNYRSSGRQTGTTLEYTLYDSDGLCFWPLDQDASVAADIHQAMHKP